MLPLPIHGEPHPTSHLGGWEEVAAQAARDSRLGLLGLGVRQWGPSRGVLGMVRGGWPPGGEAVGGMLPAGDWACTLLSP